MSISMAVAETRCVSWVDRAQAYLELTKPRIALLVLVTVAASAWIATWGQPAPGPLLHALWGTLLIAGAACAANQCLEVERDARMPRTSQRPLVQGKLTQREAVWFTAITLLSGLAWLAMFVGLATAAIGFATWFLYVAVYTPLKTVTSWNTVVGAIPGAMPVLIGWTCVQGAWDLRLAALFSLVFVWQFPHFMAIAWIYRRQYELAGFRMLPSVDPRGRWAGIQAVACAAALLPISLVPALAAPGWGSTMYAFMAVTLGLGQFVCALRFAWRTEDASARRLLWASLVYLPLVLLSLVVFPGA